jgi:hypothetical protein
MHIRLIVASAAFSAALLFGEGASAVSTLRIGSQVLTAGDSETRVTELLGKPSHKSRSRSSHGRNTRSNRSRSSGSRSRRVRVVSEDARAEKWHYRHDGHVTIVTIVDGKVSDIDDHRI